MVKYELKKIFGPLGGKIALMIYAAFLILSCWMAATGGTGIGVEFYDEQGNEITGPAAVRMIRDAQNEWEGVLDEERIAEVIRELRRIAASPEYNSDSIAQKNTAYSWQEGVRPIRYMMIDAYSSSLDEYEYNDYYIPERLSPEAAKDFYTNRMKLLTAYLETGNGKDKFTDNEKQWLVRHYADWETPIHYDYHLGWQEMLQNYSFISGYGAIVICILLVGIFTKEFRWKADAVFYTTAYGRNKAVAAKVKAGFLAVTLLYWGGMLIYTLFNLCYFGGEGAGCAVQLIHNLWECPYNWSCGGAYLMAMLCGYVGNLFAAFLTMYVSAKTKSATFSVVVAFLAVLGSWLFEMTGIEALANFALMPDRLLVASTFLHRFEVYDLGFVTAGAIPLCLVLYGAATVLLAPAMYRTYRRKRIS